MLDNDEETGSCMLTFIKKNAEVNLDNKDVKQCIVKCQHEDVISSDFLL